MPSVCFYFQVHQPYRLKKYRFFNIGKDHDYFSLSDENSNYNKQILQKVIKKCYLPTNTLLLELLNNHPEFKICFSLSGVFLEQIQEYSPEVVESFRRLVETGRVELLSETYYHSLAFLYSRKEFKQQVRQHRRLLKQLFNYEPTVFRNTELIYNNTLAKSIERMGYKGIITEGADHILDWRSPDFVYRPQGTNNIKLLLKNYKLSDDMAFRFGSKEWQEHPLTTKKFVRWINRINGNGQVVNLFMDYETFGEHQWQETGIFEFLRHLPGEILNYQDNDFVTPSEAINKFQSIGSVDMPNYISWADSERDLSAWQSNPMQIDAFNKLYGLERQVKVLKDDQILVDWRKLQTSDHFYYMCTKFWSDGDVHKYFSPFESPYEAYTYFMNVLHDLKLRVLHKQREPVKSKDHSRNPRDKKRKVKPKEEKSYFVEEFPFWKGLEKKARSRA